MVDERAYRYIHQSVSLSKSKSEPHIVYIPNSFMLSMTMLSSI